MRESTGYQIAGILWMILSRVDPDMDPYLCLLAVGLGLANVVLFLTCDAKDRFRFDRHE